MTEPRTKLYKATAAECVHVMAQDSAIKSSRRLPDKPWKYNPPAPVGAVRPKPVIVPKAK
jgi:hypothetical protein